MAKPRLKLHIIPYLRWDREGLRTFQESRLGLVRVMDHLLAAIAACPRFESLILGGQTILLDDYLEVRPQHRAAIRELAQNGRFCIGPWYVLPNDFLVSPEALIRNLLLGRQTALSLDTRCDLGYMSGVVAHVGQLPQILHGFGLESVAVVHSSPVDEALEERWLAPDGSDLLLVNLHDEEGSPLAQLAGGGALTTALSQIKNRLKDHTRAPALAVLYQSHVQEPPCGMADLIEHIQDRVRGMQVIHGDLPGYLAEVTQANRELPGYAGERLSEHPTGTLSTQIWAKQYNHDVQILLERWAEPFSAWANILSSASNRDPHEDDGLHGPGDLLAHAWQLLLPNHAYRSILGHVVDQVRHEMQVRFDQVEQIAAAITGQSLQDLADEVDTGGLPVGNDRSVVIVFNAAGHQQTGVVTVESPPCSECAGFQVVDATDSPVPTDNLDTVEETEEGLPVSRRHCVSFIAADVPAYGYRPYLLEPVVEDTRQVQVDDIPTIENQHISVSVNQADGTLTLFDKQTGRTFEQLNRFVDGGDRGDVATYCPPLKDTLIDIATNTPLHVERHTSSVQQALSYLQIFRLPHQLTAQRDARLPLTAQFVPISIVTVLRLVHDVRRLDIEVHVSNNALDHRLRVHFPTGIETSEALFDGHFEIVRRPVPGDYPQRAFVTVMGTDTGLTVANQGLPEISLLDTREGVEIALTLLRSVGWLQPDDSEGTQAKSAAPVQTPEAQCRGNYRFAYSLIPHGQDLLPAWQQAWTFQTTLRGMLTSGHPGILPVSHSLVTVDNSVFVLSAIKMAENGEGLIVRGYSISDKPQQVMLKLGFPAAHAELARIDETPIGQTIKPDSHGRYKLKVRPAEIVTLRVIPAAL